MSKLTDLELRPPHKLEKVLLELPKPPKGARSTQYAETIEMYRGKLLRRVWSYQWYGRKNQNFRFKDIIRETEKIAYVRDLMFSNVGGYSTIWEDRNYGGYYRISVDERWGEMDLERMPNIYIRELWNVQDVIKLDPSLKYFAYDGSIPLMRYIRNYRQNSKLELFGKMGLGRLGIDKRWERLSEPKKHEILLMIRNNAELIKRERLTLNDLMSSLKRHLQVPTSAEREKKVAKAVLKTDKYGKYLINLHAVYQKFEKKVDGYEFKIPASFDEFVGQGQALNQCLQRADMSYFDRMAKGEIIIVFIILEGQPYASVEIDTKKRKVYQARIVNNDQLDAEGKKALDDWVEKVYVPPYRTITKRKLICKEATR